MLARPYRDRPEIVGTVKIATGFVLFPVFYAALTWAAWMLAGPLALLYGLTLPLSGLFTLYYHEHLLRPWPLWRNLFMTPRRRYHLKRLSEEHGAILRDLDGIKDRYLGFSS